MSDIAVSFRPVSDADELTFEALEPTGFDFTGATAVSLGHEVIATNAETIRIRASMYAEVNVDIVVSNFRLGLNGGSTRFNLVTKLNNGDGDVDTCEMRRYIMQNWGMYVITMCVCVIEEDMLEVPGAAG